MFEFNLLKSMYFEMDPEKMAGVEVRKEKDKTFRTIKIECEDAPEITEITAEERVLPYLVRYYFYVNGESYTASVKDIEGKQAVLAFFRKYHPEYMKKDLPDDLMENLSDVDVLECFEPFEMPAYRPQYAFPGLVTMQEIREGTAKKDDREHTFPGIEMFSSHEKGKPAASVYNGYTELKGDRSKAQSQIELLKTQMAAELEQLSMAQAVTEDTLVVPDLEKTEEVLIEKEELEIK